MGSHFISPRIRNLIIILLIGPPLHGQVIKGKSLTAIVRAMRLSIEL